MQKVFSVSLSMFILIAACGYVSLNYYQYIDVVYTNEHILKAYSAQWWPFGNEVAIPPSNDAWTLISDPTTIRAKGRPKSTRIRNEMEWVKPSEHRQNVVDVEPKTITGVAVQCNLSVGVVQTIDLCMLVDSLVFV